MKHQGTPAERFEKFTTPKSKSLPGLVREFFEILDTIEISDMSNQEFHPTTINSCRVVHTVKLNKLLPKMKELAYRRIKKK